GCAFCHRRGMIRPPAPLISPESREYAGCDRIHVMHKLLIPLVCLMGAAMIADPAAASDPLLDSVSPMRWRARLLPEMGEELELPAYYGAADRARAYLDAGRYQRSIYELARVAEEEVDPVERALLLAEANLRLGRFDEAAAALADVEDQRAGVLSARIAAESGDPAEAARVLDAHLGRHPRSLAARLLRAE